jgi:hypothetical protein
MKIALLLSGLARKVEEGYNITWKRLIDNYDVDVYIHAWKDEEWQKVPAIYPFAKSIIIQEPFKFTKYKEGIKLPHNDTSRPLPQYDVMSCFRQLPMIYSWQNVYQQMYDTQIEYDLVIRSRYDMALYHQVDYNLLDGNYLNHAGNETSLDDNLCITNYTNAEKLYHNVFTKLIKLSKKSGVLNSAEQSWTKIVEHEGLLNKAAINPVLRFELLRDNWLWWGDEDGNIVSNKVLVR